MNHPFTLDTDNSDKKPLGRIYYHVMHALVIIALYIPLLWYALHLRRLYPHNTNLLDIQPLHLAIVIGLIIAPLVILRLLGVKWQGRKSAPPEV